MHARAQLNARALQPESVESFRIDGDVAADAMQSSVDRSRKHAHTHTHASD